MPSLSRNKDGPLLLLVGSREEDFFIIQDLLRGTSVASRAELDHASSFEEAIQQFKEKTYDLVLFQHEPQNDLAMRVLQEIRNRGTTTPFVFLAEYADENTIAEFLKSGAADCVDRNELTPASLSRAIRYAASLQEKDSQFRAADEMLKKLLRAVEHSGDLVLITDREGTIEYVNPAFEVLTGYSRHEVIGLNPRLLKSGEQDSTLYHELWETITSGKVYRGVLANKKKNGELFCVEKTIAPVRDAEGKIAHFISCDRDITERRRLEAHLFQAQKMDAIGKLAGGVAHDFNNLLMIISSSAELTLETLAAGHPSRDKVEEILSASRRAADLTRQLLAFGRKQVQVLRVLDLNCVIADITRMLPRLIGEDVQLRVVPGRGPLKVKADPVQIEQIILNLATNARDAMPHGGTLTIETGATTLDAAYREKHSMVIPGDYVMLSVSDSGQGIPPERQPHIFEPFYTTKEKGKGTGLGLATVYGIVKQSHGYVWVYSEPGMGSCFKIYLPCAHQPVEAQKKPVPHDQEQTGAETLLLVEDEEAVRAAAAEFLMRKGYTVLQASDGREAVRVAGEHPGSIDLMITDVVMPHMSGGELAHELSRPRPNMKTLFVSGYAENTLRRYGVDLRHGFLQKPFGLKTLVQKVREALDAKARAASSSV